MRRRAVSAWVVAALFGSLLGGGASPAAAASFGQDCSTASSAPTGLVEQAHPVILVHGWTGSAMQPTRALLEQQMTPGWQFLLFDYHDAATRWADAPQIAGCLADYVLEVSEAHRRAGGDGRVFFVAHSMGGLAVRFASAKAGVGERVAGMVTLDTPHAGSPWGNAGSGPWSRILELMGGYWEDIPEGGSKARECLAVHRGPAGMPRGCAVAPYLPGTTPVATIGGELTVRRTFFGFLAYDVPTGGDTIVTTDSSQGYFDSAPEGRVQTGTRVNPITVACTQDFNGIVNAVTDGATRATLLRAASSPLGDIGQLQTDYQALGDILDGTVSPALLDIVISANLVKDNCSHAGMTTNAEAIARTAEALEQQARGPSTDDAALLDLCSTTCQVSGRVSFDHPTWGRVTLSTLTPEDLPAAVSAAVVDGAGTVRWVLPGTDDDRRNYEWQLAEPATDRSGLIFVNYDPGRYNGVFVVQPVADDMRVVAGLYDTGQGQDLYSAALEGPASDGLYRVAQSANDCDPSCALGTTTTVTLRWNGSEFVPD